MKRTAMSLKWLTLVIFCVINAEPAYSQSTPSDTIVEWAKYPFYVLLTDGIGNILGGGVVLSDEFVLTSQDIVNTKKPSDIRVITETVEKHVSAIFIAEEHALGHLAVLQVSTKFDLNGTSISSIDLPTEGAPMNELCAVIGVYTDYQEKPANILYSKNVTTCDVQECEAFFSEISIPEHNLCGNYKLDSTSPFKCIQNAGDVLLCDGQLAGIASSVSKCGTTPTIYSMEVFGDVMYYKPWIVEQMISATTEDTTDTDDVTTSQYELTTLGETDTSTFNETEGSATTFIIDTTTRHSLATINSHSVALILCSITLMFTISRV